ncbi:hypothetical protein EHI45_23910 [Rhizobium leguminosarum]|nr:hypothetical protein EHI45_23910 [Rhizobium leguminosarum]
MSLKIANRLGLLRRREGAGYRPCDPRDPPSPAGWTLSRPEPHRNFSGYLQLGRKDRTGAPYWGCPLPSSCAIRPSPVAPFRRG